MPRIVIQVHAVPKAVIEIFATEKADTLKMYLACLLLFPNDDQLRNRWKQRIATVLRVISEIEWNDRKKKFKRLPANQYYKLLCEEPLEPETSLRDVLRGVLEEKQGLYSPFRGEEHADLSVGDEVLTHWLEQIKAFYKEVCDELAKGDVFRTTIIELLDKHLTTN